jgi:phosphomannomutase
MVSLSVADDLFDDAGMLLEPFTLPPVCSDVKMKYVGRYLDCFGDALRGLRVGVYQHSTVGRDILAEVLTALGAQVTALGRSDTFISVDTEAIRPEDVALGLQWAAEGSFDAIVSADGDADRPLVSDEHGVWLRGDVLGVLCAKFLGCSDVVTPVSSNTLLEKSGWFESTVRTRIGSPYVIEGMQSLLEQGKAVVAGYEANGGFLLASDVMHRGQVLKALPTRDAVIVIVCILAMARAAGVKITDLAKSLPQRFTVSDRIKDFPTQLSIDKLTALRLGSTDEQRQKLTAMFGAISGEVAGIDETDGLRMRFVNEEVIHLRPSGNAPELRCYAEAATPGRALEINQLSMRVLNVWRGNDTQLVKRGT